MAPPRTAFGLLLKIAFGAGVAAVVGWLVWSAICWPNRWFGSPLLTLVSLLLCALYMLRSQQHWTSPTRRMVQTLEQIRCGKAPIEELSTIAGGLEPLVQTIRQILQERRQQKLAFKELNQEMSQRVALRTLALERQIGSLRQQATRDILTGLFNRRMLDGYLPQLTQQCIEQKLDLSLLLIDVDDFKLLNDTLGHTAGDELLRDIGQIIRSGIREQDTAFRVGGDEFVIVMPGSGPDAVERFASRLCDLIDALTKLLRLSRPPRLSIGWVCLSQLPGNPSVRDLIEVADKRLYEMKSSHRPRQAAG